MRRVFILFILLLLPLFIISATTETLQSKDFEISAYKNAPTKVCTATVTTMVSDSFLYTYGMLSAQDNVFDVTAMLSSNSSISGAIKVKMSTNMKTPNLKVKLTLYPFIQREDSSKIIKVKYTPQYTSYTLRNISYNSGTYTCTASLNGRTPGNDPVPYPASTAIPVNDSSGVTIELYCTVTGYPEGTGGSTLPGLTQNQVLEPECTLTMSLAGGTDGKFDGFEKKKNYYADVKVIFEQI